MNVDFHIHTNNSDGGYSFDKIIKECLKNNVSYIAITDHNTFNLYDDYKGIKSIDGMELDVRYSGHVFHMLLYDFNINSKRLNEYFKRSRRHEIYLFHKNIKLLEEVYHFKIDKKFISSFIRDNNYFDIIRMNKLLVEYHVCDSLKDAYYDYTHIIPANKRYRIDMEKFVDIAKESNGIMSLAHPLRYGLDIKEIKEIILDLKDKYHLQVVEAINNHQTILEEKELVEFCKRNNLLISAGSDSHYKIGVKTKKKIGYALDHQITLDDVTFLKLVNKSKD